MTTATQLLNKYATTPVSTANATNPHRVVQGNVFMQPTGGKNGKPFNFSYCYFGIRSKAGDYCGGFSMSNKGMLESVEAGALSKDFIKLFEAFATANAEQTLIK